jgi:hypothetical protein
MSLTISGIAYAAFGSNSNASSVLLTSKIIIYGFCNGTSTATSSVISLAASNMSSVSTDYWTIVMTIKGNTTDNSDTYTIFYYGI